MIIKFTSDEEFQRLLDTLDTEIWQAKDHYKLYCDLKAEVENYWREYSQAQTFWFLTFRAHIDAVLFRLIRIYDENPKSLSLRNLLDTIEAHKEVFDESRFRERLKGNPFVDSLASDSKTPDPAQLTRDIVFVSNGLANKLTKLRNNLFAHRNAKNTVKDYDIAATCPLTVSDVEKLVTEASDILNRYKYLFKAAISASSISGHDDFKSVLQSVRETMDQSEREIKEQWEKYESERS